MTLSNRQIANLLDEIAHWRQLRGDNPFRVAAYRRAAVSVRNCDQPLAVIFARDGLAGLRQLPGVGASLGRRLSEIVRTGHSRLLDRLKSAGPTDLLTTLPNVGPRLAQRIESSLGTSSLDELLRAARDGRLRRVAGLGRKRVEAIRESLASRLGADPAMRTTATTYDATPVAELLDVDRQYRQQARRGTLLRVAPRRFNPAGVAWLPILRTERKGRQYLAHFTNSVRSHQTGHVYDWVIIFREDKDAIGQWTLITATHGPLAGKRVVRGRERECQQHYNRRQPLQMHLPEMDED
ncbi:MAG: helix-hairpin-helix domain-containing protein [Pirellulales bacterium]